MKKMSFSLLTMLLCAFGFLANAQITPVCSLKAKFDFKTDNCFVKFADLSAVGTGTSITNWYWDLGDATSSTLQNPTHTYAANGTYTVCLTIVGKNANGLQCKDKFCLPVTIQGCGQQPCKLAAKYDFKVDGCKVIFTDLSAAAPGTTITNWSWDFGDATSSTLQNPVHAYAGNGTYNVCLTIVGNNGLVKCTDKICIPVTIQGCGQVEPCKLAAKFKFKTEACKAGFADISVAAPGTTITNWYWDFGDATTSTLQNPIHTYAANGTYTVCLTIVGVNAAGVKCKDQFCLPITIEGCGQTEPCVVTSKFDFKADKCNVSFFDLSTVSAGTTITNWYWNFGDAGTSTLQNPTHTYTVPGTYTVCLVIVGIHPATGIQCKSKFCLPVTVEGCGDPMPCGVKPLFDFKIDKCTVYFVDNSGTNPGTTITNWYWNFGDGNTSTLQNPTHAYAANGTYNVCLIVVGVNTAGQQCKNEYCFPVKIDGCGDPMPCGVKPLFDFKIDKCTVYFVDNSGTNPGTTITNWYWNFGDGNTSTLQNPTHTYAANGTYSVCLVVVGVNAAGQQCKNEYCFPVKIDGCGQTEPCRLAAKFEYKMEKCTVYFADLSAAGAGTTITNWYWDFGDGNTSTLQNPTHTYLASGAYTVCLTVVGVNANGEQCKDRYCIDIKVEGCGDPQPCKVGAKFDVKIDQCTVYFTDFSASGAGTTITNWYWDFGDGNTSTLQNPVHTYTAAGAYVVCLTVVGVNANGEQCKDRYCIDIKVEGCGDPQPCNVGAKFDVKIDQCTVYFTDFSASGAGTTITNWYWDFGDGNTSTLQNPVLTYTAAGAYVVCLTVVGVNANGEQCKDRYCMDVNVNCESVQHPIDTKAGSTLSSLEVYPNPASDVVNMQFKLATAGQVAVTITDIQGRILSVVQDGYLNEGFHKLNWNVDVRSGLYFITIRTAEGTQQKQLIIQE